MTAERHAEISKRAYSIREGEGRPSGRELDHWLRAEAELDPPPAAVAAQAQDVRAKASRPLRRRTRQPK